MSVEFVDTNILIYAHDQSATIKHAASVKLLTRLFEERTGATSVQVLTEFYSAATRRLGMKSQDAQDVIEDLRVWTTHRMSVDSVIRAINLQRRYKLAWWDSLILNSALELGCSVLWTEDFTDGQRFANTKIRNPFIHPG